MDQMAMNRALIRISHEIIERNHGTENLVLIGILRRGVPMAERIADHIQKAENVQIPVGTLDITFYRDDLTMLQDQPEVAGTSLPFSVKGKKVILIKRHPMGKSYLAICLFGLVFSVRPLNAAEYNHERIHAVQQKELLYLPFFVWYVIEWLILLVIYRDGKKAYRNIRFEKEAYNHQNDLDYLKKRKHFHYK